LAFNDGTNNFTFTAAAGNTLANLVTAINANANFVALTNGNNLVITAKNGNAINFTTNSLTDAGTGALAESFAPTGTNTAAGTFSTAEVVHDALGASHVLTINFTKTATNTWNYQISIPQADLAPGGNPVVSSGTLTSNGSGQLVTPATNLTGLTISNLADGASPITFDWNLFNANGCGLVTQVAGPSATSSTQQDGYASGSLLSFAIGGDGVIQGIFSNGQTSLLGQIALASFSNEQGLIRNDSNEFLASLASGAANVGQPNTGGRGSISGGALEQSNVDIATQFAQLILAERDYQANTKAVTTFDEVTQTAINLKQ
jgi:flagellar hook protein FlgE